LNKEIITRKGKFMGMGPGGEVTLRFLNADKSKRAPEVKGTFVKFFSISRKNRVQAKDPQSPPVELGSKDWLTDVLLADTQERLNELRPDNDLDAASTFSSRHVHLQFDGIDPDTGARVKGEERDAVVIAPKDAIIPLGGGKSRTDILEVYPPGTSIGGVGGIPDLAQLTK
jgi:hypothetical protein